MGNQCTSSRAVDEDVFPKDKKPGKRIIRARKNLTELENDNKTDSIKKKKAKNKRSLSKSIGSFESADYIDATGKLESPHSISAPALAQNETSENHEDESVKLRKRKRTRQKTLSDYMSDKTENVDDPRDKHSKSTPIEWAVPYMNEPSRVKIIDNKSSNEIVDRSGFSNITENVIMEESIMVETNDGWIERIHGHKPSDQIQNQFNVRTGPTIVTFEEQETIPIKDGPILKLNSTNGHPKPRNKNEYDGCVGYKTDLSTFHREKVTLDDVAMPHMETPIYDTPLSRGPMEVLKPTSTVDDPVYENMFMTPNTALDSHKSHPKLNTEACVVKDTMSFILPSTVYNDGQMSDAKEDLIILHIGDTIESIMDNYNSDGSEECLSFMSAITTMSHEQPAHVNLQHETDSDGHSTPVTPFYDADSVGTSSITGSIEEIPKDKDTKVTERGLPNKTMTTYIDAISLTAKSEKTNTLLTTDSDDLLSFELNDDNDRSMNETDYSNMGTTNTVYKVPQRVTNSPTVYEQLESKKSNDDISKSEVSKGQLYEKGENYTIETEAENDTENEIHVDEFSNVVKTCEMISLGKDKCVVQRCDISKQTPLDVYSDAMLSSAKSTLSIEFDKLDAQNTCSTTENKVNESGPINIIIEPERTSTSSINVVPNEKDPKSEYVRYNTEKESAFLNESTPSEISSNNGISEKGSKSKYGPKSNKTFTLFTKKKKDHSKVHQSQVCYENAKGNEQSDANQFKLAVHAKRSDISSSNDSHSHTECQNETNQTIDNNTKSKDDVQSVQKDKKKNKKNKNASNENASNVNPTIQPLPAYDTISPEMKIDIVHSTITGALLNDNQKGSKGKNTWFKKKSKKAPKQNLYMLEPPPSYPETPLINKERVSDINPLQKKPVDTSDTPDHQVTCARSPTLINDEKVHVKKVSCVQNIIETSEQISNMKGKKQITELELQQLPNLTSNTLVDTIIHNEREYTGPGLDGTWKPLSQISSGNEMGKIPVSIVYTDTLQDAIMKRAKDDYSPNEASNKFEDDNELSENHVHVSSNATPKNENLGSVKPEYSSIGVEKNLENGFEFSCINTVSNGTSPNENFDREKTNHLSVGHLSSCELAIQNDTPIINPTNIVKTYEGENETVNKCKPGAFRDTNNIPSTLFLSQQEMWKSQNNFNAIEITSINQNVPSEKVKTPFIGDDTNYKFNTREIVMTSIQSKDYSSVAETSHPCQASIPADTGDSSKQHQRVEQNVFHFPIASIQDVKDIQPDIHSFHADQNAVQNASELCYIGESTQDVVVHHETINKVVCGASLNVSQSHIESVQPLEIANVKTENIVHDYIISDPKERYAPSSRPVIFSDAFKVYQSVNLGRETEQKLNDEVRLRDKMLKNKQGLLELDTSFENILELPDTLSKLNEIQSLRLDKNWIQYLPDTIEEMNSLESISYRDSHLLYLPENIVKCKWLKYLDLDNNMLSSLPSSLSQLKELIWLSIRSNRINPWPDVINKLTNLQGLDLSCNTSLVYINNGNIGHLKNLRCVSMDKTSLIEIPADISKCTNLVSISLNSNRISKIPTTIAELSNLKSLFLADNRIKFFPEDLCKMTSLTELDISKNRIQVIPNSISNLTKLKLLNLEETGLEKFPIPVTKLISLESLNLGNNKLIDLPQDIVLLFQLRNLELCSNKFKNLPEWLFSLSDLDALNLSNNAIREIPKELETLTKLRTFDISNNQIMGICGDLNNLAIEQLDISYNMFCYIPDKVTVLKNLTEFTAKGNGIKDLPNDFVNLASLKHVDLSRNKIETITPPLDKLIFLSHVNLSDNKLSQLGKGFANGLPSLIQLNIQNNYLRQFPQSIFKCTQLEILQIDGNKIASIPHDIGFLEHLQILSMSQNCIVSLPDEICDLEELRTLNIRQNNVQKLPLHADQLRNIDPNKFKWIAGASGFVLDEEQMVRPPPEVIRAGRDSIFQYLKELRFSKAVTTHRRKIVLLGHTGAGKSSFANALLTGASHLTEPDERTRVMEQHMWNPAEDIQCQINDFGGHDIYTITHHFFLTTEAIYLIVLDLSIYTTDNHYQLVQKWIDLLTAHVPNAVVRFVATHSDLCSPAYIEQVCANLLNNIYQNETRMKKYIQGQMSLIERNTTEGINLNSPYMDMPETILSDRKKHFESLLAIRPHLPSTIDVVSSAEGLAGINCFVSNLMEQSRMQNLFRQRILPTSWLSFEEAILRKRQNTKVYLTWKDMETIADENYLDKDQIRVVVPFLTEIGEVLWYKDEQQLQKVVFHRPSKLADIMRGIFKHDIKEYLESRSAEFVKVMESTQDTNSLYKRMEDGIFPTECFRLFWDDVDDNTFQVFFNLMQAFHLCYVHEYRSGGRIQSTVCFPSYLPENPPADVLKIWPISPIGEDHLEARLYFFPQLPSNFIEEATVRLQAVCETVHNWRNGFYATSGTCRIYLNKNTDKMISWAVRGDMLQLVWSTFLIVSKCMETHMSCWPGAIYETYMVCGHCVKVGLENPHMFPGEILNCSDLDDYILCCPKAEKQAMDPVLLRPPEDGNFCF